MEILKTQNKLCLSCMEEYEVQEVAVPEENVFNGTDKSNESECCI